MAYPKILTAAWLLEEHDKHDLMVEYLTNWGYASVQEWAADSDYRPSERHDGWEDVDGNPVDIEGMLLGAIESMNEGR